MAGMAYSFQQPKTVIRRVPACLLELPRAKLCSHVMALHQSGGPGVPNDNSMHPSSAIWTQILTDVHFWVPLIVLAAGLAVLHWIR